jgi:hypothetical protein
MNSYFQNKKEEKIVVIFKLNEDFPFFHIVIYISPSASLLLAH